MTVKFFELVKAAQRYLVGVHAVAKLKTSKEYRSVIKLRITHAKSIGVSSTHKYCFNFNDSNRLSNQI